MGHNWEQKKQKTKKSRKKGKVKIPLTCGYCGEDLKLFTTKRGINRGRIIETTSHSLILKIKCPSCKYYQQFERSSPTVGKWGWRRIDLPFEPSSMRPRIDEIDKTVASLQKRRHRKRAE